MDNRTTGFIKLHRSIRDWSWYDDPNTFTVFVHLLVEANWKDESEWHSEKIGRGEIITSIAKLAASSGLSEKKVRTALDHLVDGGEIVKKTANKWTKITICKYADYQDEDSDSGQTKGEQRANKGQTKGKQRATSKEYKNIRIEEKEYKEKDRLSFPFISDAFLSAWNLLVQQPKWNKKTISALQLSLNKLSKYDEEFAIELIKLAIERGWQGVVFKDTDEQYDEWKAVKSGQGKRKTQNGSTMDQYQQALLQIDKEYGFKQGTLGIDEQ